MQKDLSAGPEFVIRSHELVYSIFILSSLLCWFGNILVKVLCYKSEGRWFDPNWCHWALFIDIKPFRSHYGPGVDSVYNRNEYQEHLLGLKAAGA